MTDQSWPLFDEDLRIRLQKIHEPCAKEIQHVEKTPEHEVAPVTATSLAKEFTDLTKCVYETIKEIVPEKKWIKKNGRVVSKETKKLFEERAKQFNAIKPTAAERKAWNRRIRNACRTDYRSWITSWVQKIEAADNKGDTKAIFRGVKALSGSTATSATRPTEHWTGSKEPLRASGESKTTDGKTSKDSNGRGGNSITDGTESRPSSRKAGKRIDSPQELADIWKEFLGTKFSATTREHLRAEFEDLPEKSDPDEMLTRQEYDDAVDSMKMQMQKAPGMDKIPAEVWKNSKVARDSLFCFLQKI